MNLSSGEYTFEELKAKKDVLIKFDLSGGPIAIGVTGDLQLHPGVQMAIVSVAGDSSDIMFQVLGEVDLKKGGQFLGAYVARGNKGKIEVEELATVEGDLWSLEGEVKIKQNAVVLGNINASGKVKLKEGSLVQGNVVSGRDVRLKELATVNGEVTASREVTLREGAEVTGAINEQADVSINPRFRVLGHWG